MTPKLNGNIGWLVNLLAIVAITVSGTLWFSQKFNAIEMFHKDVRLGMLDRWTATDQYVWVMQLEGELDVPLPNPLTIVKERRLRQRPGP